MSRDPRMLLLDMLEAARTIQEWVGGRTEADYLGDLYFRSAVERQLLIIGEALTQLRQTAPDISGTIPDERLVIAFRNLLVHAYSAVDHERVWRTIHQDLPVTLAAVEVLLPDD
jgi:uncharacterized protein with HEPN domain